ncbi:MAG TPA: PCRF domain-containing protein, partial [Thermohalobaculum sp.]|nr:PCRF domain-containing protein [Thermohalobaculum sp.]
MVPEDRLQEILDRFGYLEARMGGATDPAELAALGRDYAGLREVVATAREWRKTRDELASARAMLDDPEMAALARDEVAALEARLPGLEEALRLALLPKDWADDRPAIVEIRPGTGGDEAALFAGDLFRMYQRYAERQ